MPWQFEMVDVLITAFAAEPVSERLLDVIAEWVAFEEEESEEEAEEDSEEAAEEDSV